MAPLDELLEDVSHDKICGEDLEVRGTGQGDEGELTSLEKLLERVKLPVQPPKDPQGDEVPVYGRTRSTTGDSRDWKSICDEASALFKQSKDLRIALILCLGLLKTRQLAGFQEGMTFLRKLVEKYWGSLYPKSPRRRVNILNSLSLPAHRVDSSYDFVHTLRAVALARPAKQAALSLNDIRANEKASLKEPEKAAALGKKIKDAFLASDTAALKELYDSLNFISEEMNKLRKYLDGKDVCADFSSADETLKEMAFHLEPYVKVVEKEEVKMKTGNNEGRVGPDEKHSVRSASANGNIASIDDVTALLGQICRYYELHDRSSPVPLLLRRVERLARMDFSQIMEEMTAEEIAKLRTNATKEATNEPNQT
ncbi:MAG TPA: type VI secretion system ImpA family N-terminal domain-containing protein [Verrucomicrobiae bacterium]|nr:type VI secretion system ImpA family N-terminal domain-containing protein [Verrucomicrobiae bacterium]